MGTYNAMDDAAVLRGLEVEGSDVARTVVDPESGELTLTDDQFLLALTEEEYKRDDAPAQAMGDMVHVDPEVAEMVEVAEVVPAEGPSGEKAKTT